MSLQTAARQESSGSGSSDSPRWARDAEPIVCRNRNKERECLPASRLFQLLVKVDDVSELAGIPTISRQPSLDPLGTQSGVRPEKSDVRLLLGNVGRECNHRREVSEIGRHDKCIAYFCKVSELGHILLSNTQLHGLGPTVRSHTGRNFA